jgi:prepilin-type N-terminal cleavage/methylation domain-containing protein
MRFRSKQSAFTLLELLVALALMVALTSSLYVSFRIAFKSQDHANAALAPARAAMHTLELMRMDLESAMVPNNVLAGAFEGTPAGQTPTGVSTTVNLGIGSTATNGATSDTLTFYSCAHSPENPYAALAQAAGQTPAAPTTACDVRLVAYALVPQPNDTTGTLFLLQRSITTNLLAPVAPVPILENLCANVLSLHFQYFDGINWWPNWDSTQQGNTLPTAVQVTLQFQPPVVGQPDPNNPPAPYEVTRIFQPQCSPSPIGNPIQGTQGVTTQ